MTKVAIFKLHRWRAPIKRRSLPSHCPGPAKHDAATLQAYASGSRSLPLFNTPEICSKSLSDVSAHVIVQVTRARIKEAGIDMHRRPDIAPLQPLGPPLYFGRCLLRVPLRQINLTEYPRLSPGPPNAYPRGVRTRGR
jgi:hypothetical protein